MHTITAGDFSIPALGFGTYQLEGEAAIRAIQYALDVGYRHIDTAQVYGNEAEVGQAIQQAGIPREEIFVTTKVWVDRFQADQLAASVDESLSRLQLEQVDLLLLHWPNPDVPLSETIEALMAVKAAGKTRNIGVSNFTTALMREAVAVCQHTGELVNNQIEYHPFLWQDKVIDEASALGMTVTAYRPIAKGHVFQEDTLNQIAAAHHKTAAQVTLRWIIQQGIVAIPRSSQPEHIQQNFQIFDFSLSESEMQAINNLRGDHRLVSPQGLAPQWDRLEPSVSSIL